ncbi:MAG TPA: hypothetical protein VGI81_10085 [Tepidisphaeraceae bacterium]|jgi:hypothetical protein
MLPDRLEPRTLWSGTTPITTQTPLIIQGVQPAAFDQPQIHAAITRPGDTQPLSADDGFGGTTFDVQAFLDTGTSGFVLSQETAQALGIASEQVNGANATYYDFGVAGAEDFDISEPLNFSLAPFQPNADVDNPADWQTVYNQTVGPVRTEVNRYPADDLVGPIDIVGMPAMQGKVVVMDPTPVDNLAANMNTYIYDPGTPFNPATSDTDPGIPTVNNYVKLSYGDFSQFTETDPASAQPPTATMNPFIGPNPVNQLLTNPPPDNTPPVTISMGALTTTGSFLFDTGSAASFISTDLASKVGVSYAPGTYNTDNPQLVDANGNPIPNQFQIPIGGLGGSTLNVAGFFLDSMTLQTVNGPPIEFEGAPVLVADISVVNPNTGQSLTLDGDFGMNYLVASTNIDSSGNFGASRDGPFQWVTFDQPNGLLGLQLPQYAPLAQPRPKAGVTKLPTVTYGGRIGVLDTQPTSSDLVGNGGTTTTGPTDPSDPSDPNWKHHRPPRGLFENPGKSAQAGSPGKQAAPPPIIPPAPPPALVQPTLPGNSRRPGRQA